MDNEIISYLEMCQREGTSLQRGMNYRVRPTHSVFLTSVRPNAPYDDRFEEEGTVLIYEGHDVSRSSTHPDPKAVDQPAVTPRGSLTQNGKFHAAARAFKSGEHGPETIRVYEKLRSGIWAYSGPFHLTDSWQEKSGNRFVFKFRLVAIPEQDEGMSRLSAPPRRLISSRVKLEVWKRDGGECVLCGAAEDLHFDHIIPFSKGGSSLTAENVQLLCARHNLEKSDRIE